MLYLDIDILIFNQPSFSPGECSGASSRKIGGHCNNLIMGMSESHGNNSHNSLRMLHTRRCCSRRSYVDRQ